MKRFEELLESLRALPPELLRLGFGRQAAEEARGEIAELRRKAVAERTRTLAEVARQVPPLETDLTKALAEVLAAMAALHAKESAAHSAYGRLFEARARVPAIERKHAALLRATAPAAIAAAVADLEREYDRVRNEGSRESREACPARVTRGIGTEAKFVYFSNAQGLAEVLVAIRAAITAVQALTYTTADEAEAVAAIEKLNARIPYQRLNDMERCSLASDVAGA